LLATLNSYADPPGNQETYEAMNAISPSGAAGPRIKLLAIDDDPENLDLVSEALAGDGLDILTADRPERALEFVRRERSAIVLSDLQLLSAILEVDPGIDVVLVTAHYSADAAIEAIKKGACDYLTKPTSIPQLRERIEKLAHHTLRRQGASGLDSELTDTCQFEGMIGRSALMWEMFARIRRIAPHYRTCAVTGPTGAGKELVAHALHTLSQVSGPMVVCNCSAVVETLFESELFGHVKGAFTGADSHKMGLFEYAHGGTLFLDEIGDMPLSTQAKLLRVLQNREVQRVGSLTARQVDVRVVAATNHDLRAQIAEKRFREDLYYRLSMVEIQTPALANRKEDLPLLEHYFMRRFSAQYQKPVESITQSAQTLLAGHAWPGNVRELENVIGHACMLTSGDAIDVADLPQYMRQDLSRAEPAGAVADLTFDGQERRVIERALDRAGGNQVHAARMLSISRDKLRSKIKKHNLR
jgi:DNA-binding NtrC family response regulator